MKYTLIAVTGQSPQVITETVWSLARQEQAAHVPEAVHVITTSTGAAYVRALLNGEEAHDPQLGTPIQGAEDRWTRMCSEVLGLDGPVPLHVHVPDSGGRALPDIRTPADDTAFADLCYAQVADLTQPGQLPLIGSVAGGRKTMSAHLMTAFSVYARAEDRLTHVLVNPPALEGDTDFFYPTPATASKARVERVDVQFPRLHSLLQDEFMDGLPGDRRDLRGILNALEPYLALSQTPNRVELQLRSGEAHLRLASSEGTMGVCRLTPAEAATLAVLVEQIEVHGGAAPFEAFYFGYDSDTPPSRHLVHQQREAIKGLCERMGGFAPWTANDDVSKAVSRLKEKLRTVPAAAKYFGAESTIEDRQSMYRWPQPLPAAPTVTATYPPNTWLFDHLPAPQ